MEETRDVSIKLHASGESNEMVATLVINGEIVATSENTIQENEKAGILNALENELVPMFENGIDEYIDFACGDIEKAKPRLTVILDIMICIARKCKSMQH